MYESYKICSELSADMHCLVLEQYDSGKFERVFHQHFPKLRISKEQKLNLLKAFVVRFSGRSGLAAEGILRAYLNGRGKNPPAENPFQIATSYPEPGVLRTYCGTNTKAWIDEVIAANDFRIGGK